MSDKPDTASVSLTGALLDRVQMLADAEGIAIDAWVLRCVEDAVGWAERAKGEPAPASLRPVTSYGKSAFAAMQDAKGEPERESHITRVVVAANPAPSDMNKVFKRLAEAAAARLRE